MRIALFQNAARSGDPAAQLATLRRVADKVAGRADVLVCPELFMTGYNIGADAARRLAQPANGGFAQAAMSIAATTGLALIYGFPERDGDRTYNSAIAIDHVGRRLALHRKLYLPGVYEKAAFATGNRHTTFMLGAVKCGLLICYDVEFPETARALAQSGVELVIVPTALGARWSRLARTMVPTRAVENGVFLAYVDHAGAENGLAYAGLSCLVGPDGLDRARAGTGEELLIVEFDAAEIAEARMALPYLDEVRRDLA